MRLPKLFLVAALPALACTNDLDAPWNYAVAGPGDIALTCDDVPGAAVDATFTYLPAMPMEGEAPFAWSATGLPDGLMIDPQTGEITGTPTAAGDATFELTVTDAEMATGTAMCMLSVNERFSVDLDVDKNPYCAIAGENLLDFVVPGTGDGSPITCTHDGGSGDGSRPAGISVDEMTCDLAGTLMETRYGTWVFIVRGSQSGVDVHVPYCVTNDMQLPGEFDIQVDVPGMPGVDADLIPYKKTFNPDAQFTVGGAGLMDPFFTITDPGVCPPNACYFGYIYGINASPFCTEGADPDDNADDPPVVVSSALLDDMNGNPIGFTHEINFLGPNPCQNPEERIAPFRDRPWVVNMTLDYCLSDTEPECEGAMIAQNANAHLEYSVVMVPE